MRRSLLYRAPLLAAMAALVATTEARADLILCGTVSCGTYVETDGDIYIYNATLVVGTGSTKTLTLRANNGSIYIGQEPGSPPFQCGAATFGINGAGADRASNSGLAGGDGFNVVLETTTTGSLPARARDIVINFSIDCSGGDGGSGAQGVAGHFKNCSYVAATSGVSGGAGSDGGYITITSAEDIDVLSQLLTFGGVGAPGGYAGAGLGASPGAAGHGGDGGIGGAVTITQTGSAPANSAITFGGSSGGVDAHGGLAGAGGFGALGNPVPSNGGNGGLGGDGGEIIVDGRNIFMTAAFSRALISVGGGGGVGGNGSDGVEASCYTYCTSTFPHLRRTVYATPGSDGGLGGHGGDASPITIFSDDEFTMAVTSALEAFGGHGAAAGQAGKGSIEAGNTCTSSLTCTDRSAHGPGDVLASGDGGHGAVITVVCDELALGWLSSSSHATLTTAGGNGANGIAAPLPTVVCCDLPPVVVIDVAPGAQGGEGGTGGNGADIDLTYATFSFSMDHFEYCGGNGTTGGTGGNGSPAGAGGPGGNCGGSGDLVLNGTPQLIPCSMCSGVTGAAGTTSVTCPGGG